MFQLLSKMVFINIDIDYLKSLHEVCDEVQYKEFGYDSKTFIGILINNNNYKYVIPLTSAKEKHKLLKNVEKEQFLVYEYTNSEKLSSKDIWVEGCRGKVKHIMSLIDIKKMIPIKEGCYSIVDLNQRKEDNKQVKKYKDLLNKEYSFCLKIIDELIEKADRIYSKQITSGKVQKFCCDFRTLEKACDTYHKKCPYTLDTTNNKIQNIAEND